MMRDLAVVGLGLIGSAAVRHGAAQGTVIGIGPAEPAIWADYDGPFASHYDSGRITRTIDAKRQWAVLAARAIEQYPVIEQRSGLTFHRDSGVVFVRNDRLGVDRLTTVAEQVGAIITHGPVADVVSDLTMLNLPSHYTAVREGAPAGAIDPRTMIAAQHRVAESDGAVIVRDTVAAVRPMSEGFEVETVTGRVELARNVVVAAGAYTAELLGINAAAAIRPEIVVKALISADEVQRLAEMPSVLYLLDHPTLDDVYIVPPALYPDGRWYIKIGGSQRDVAPFADRDAMDRSMRCEPEDERISALRDVLVDVLPDVAFDGWSTSPCLITDTSSGLPFVDRLDNGVTVAFGGNGHAAKSGDAIGALAVDLAIAGRWPEGDLEADDFTIRLGAYRPPTGSRHGN